MGGYTTGPLGRLSWRRERGEVAAPIDPLADEVAEPPTGLLPFNFRRRL